MPWLLPARYQIGSLWMHEISKWGLNIQLQWKQRTLRFNVCLEVPKANTGSKPRHKSVIQSPSFRHGQLTTELQWCLPKALNANELTTNMHVYVWQTHVIKLLFGRRPVRLMKRTRTRENLLTPLHSSCPRGKWENSKTLPSKSVKLIWSIKLR